MKNKRGLITNKPLVFSTSDGEKIANPKHFNRLYHKLKVAQKELSRKTKGSSNQDKARLKVAKIHAQIKDARTDFLHKLTTELVRNNSLIAIENLAVRNMARNRKLARSISDAAWGEMFRQLEYKCEWYGRKLVKIDRFFPFIFVLCPFAHPTRSGDRTILLRRSLAHGSAITHRQASFSINAREFLSQAGD